MTKYRQKHKNVQIHEDLKRKTKNQKWTNKNQQQRTPTTKKPPALIGKSITISLRF